VGLLGRKQGGAAGAAGAREAGAKSQSDREEAGAALHIRTRSPPGEWGGGDEV
jgi:hypothetical protein